MKKRLISLLLVACTLLSLFPTVLFAASAEESLPKDESQSGVSSAPQTETLTEKTAYDGLYVGADGSTTANGGKLVALFTAFGTDASADLTAGTWSDKMNGNVATLRGDGWTVGAKGGIGYDLPNAEFETKAYTYGVALPEALLTANVSVETLGVVKGLRNEDGTLITVSNTSNFHNNKAKDASFVRMDLLYGVFFAGFHSSNSSQTYGARWLLSRWVFSQYWGNANTTHSKQVAQHDGVYADAAVANGNKPPVMGAYYERTTADDGSQTYKLAYLVGKQYTASATVADIAKYDAAGVNSKDTAPLFSFFNGVPSDVYAIRVYSAPLTAAERTHNAFVDLMAYANVDLTMYNGLTSSSRATVESIMSQYSFGASTEDIQAAMDDILNMMTPDVSLDDVLYVTDGLVGLFAAYKNYDTGTLEMSTGLSWFNAANPAQAATLRGDGWTKKENGGFAITRTLAEYNKDKTFGIYLPAELLPEQSYTVEFVATPDGITVENADGTRSRYIDTTTPTGTWHEYGIAIGPYRAYQAACYRNDGRDAQMERRWVYRATGGLAAAGYKYLKQDKAWERLDFGQTVTYGITFDYTAGDGVYRNYSDQKKLYDLSITAEQYIAAADAGNMFQLMVGVAGTVYSVRVYDRALTADEMAQNHVADLLYYYDLDMSVLLSISEKVDNIGGLFGAFSGIDFGMTREAAQEKFDACLGAIWLAYNGVGIRADGKDGIRFYFDVVTSAADNMAMAGYQVEIGTLISVGKSVMPAFEGDNFDYKVVGYDSDSGKNTGFFVADNTFATTILYENLDKSTALTNIYVRGYVKLVDEEGETLIFYVDPDNTSYSPDALFKIYHSMQNAAGLSANAALKSHMKEIVNACYEKPTVYVNAAAAAGGDGTEAKPYRSFAEGWAEAKDILAKAALPTNAVIMLADGEYGIYGTATLTGEEMPYVYSALTVTSENGKSILTTTVDMDASKFTEYADNVWVCQLEKEAGGAYPAFRYLYVDGRMCDVAYSGGRHAVDEDVHVAAFERTYDAIYEAAKGLYTAGILTESSVGDYPAAREDLHASFESYKQKFLALMEVEKLVAANVLIRENAPSSANEIYGEAFEAFKLNRLAMSDLVGQYIASGRSNEKFSTFAPTKANDAEYTKVFTDLRQTIVDDKKIGAFEDYYTTVAPDDMITIGKYYMPYDMVETFADELEEGKAKNEAVYVALLAEYLAADEATKAEMEDDLLAAAERTGELTWFRYALEHEEVEMHMAGQWWYNILGVAGVDFEDVAYDKEGNMHVACYMKLDEYKRFFVHGDYSMAGRYVCFKNALDYVDKEGEFYYDEANGKVYYYSENGMVDKKVARPTNDYMLVMENVHDVNFIDVIFTGVDDYYMTHNAVCLNLGGDDVYNPGSAYPTRSAIYVTNVNGLSLYDCVIHDVGAKGLQISEQMKNVSIEGCEIYRIGANALYLGDCTLSRTGSDAGRYGIDNVTITDNHIHDIALEYHNATAVYLAFAKNSTISHNTIHDCSYTAIGVGLTFSADNFDPATDDKYNHYNLDISYNFIYSYLTEIGDAGGIYVTGANAGKNNTDLFNFIHHNYILLTNITGNGRGHMLVGIYFDGSTSNWKCYENVVVEHSYGAVAGEYDDLFAEGDRYVTMLRARFGGTTPIYVQHITSQITHNILIDSNYVINVRATDPKKQKNEVYKTYIVAARNIVEQNTRYINGVDAVPVGGEDIMYAAGSYGQTGNPEIIWNNDY